MAQSTNFPSASLTKKEASWVIRLFNREAYPPEYQELKFRLHREMLSRVNLELLSALPELQMRDEIRGIVAHLVEEEESPLSFAEKEQIIEEVLDEVFGLGPLEPLLQDPTVSDILVTTPKLVYVERAGKLYRTPVEFKDNAHLMRIIEKIVSRVGRRVDESSPMVDARLPDGSRVNAVVPPVAMDGPILSIRRFGHTPLTDRDLIEHLTLTQGMMDLLHACVRSRLNVIISGGTGSGKTTFLNDLERRFLNPSVSSRSKTPPSCSSARSRRSDWSPAPLTWKARARSPSGTVVINALRMRPDRIIVGEVRGEEALDMMQAMNTGHDGSLTTIHANSPRDAIARIEVMLGMANANMSMRSIRQQITSAVHLIIQVARSATGPAASPTSPNASAWRAMSRPRRISSIRPDGHYSGRPGDWTIPGDGHPA